MVPDIAAAAEGVFKQLRFTACNHVFESGPTIYTTRDGVRMTKAGIVKAKFSRRPQAWWRLRREPLAIRLDS